MKTQHTPGPVKYDEDNTAYITEWDGLTRIYVLPNDEGWILERQQIGGDENPERVSEHATQDDAMADLLAIAIAQGQ